MAASASPNPGAFSSLASRLSASLPFRGGVASAALPSREGRAAVRGQDAQVPAEPQRRNRGAPSSPMTATAYWA